MPEVTPSELVILQHGMTEQQKMLFISQYSSDKKDRNSGLLLSVLLGSVGADRFYVGDIGLGILKLATVGGCGIWAVVDWFLVRGKVDDYNRQKAQEIAAAIKASAPGVPYSRPTAPPTREIVEPKPAESSPPGIVEARLQAIGTGNTRTCIYCAASLAEASKFCDACGRQLLCLKCGTPLGKDTRFCGSCGEAFKLL